jgi:hypothetical protein
MRADKVTKVELLKGKLPAVANPIKVARKLKVLALAALLPKPMAVLVVRLAPAVVLLAAAEVVTRWLLVKAVVLVARIKVPRVVLKAAAKVHHPRSLAAARPPIRQLTNQALLLS